MNHMKEADKQDERRRKEQEIMVQELGRMAVIDASRSQKEKELPKPLLEVYRTGAQEREQDPGSRSDPAALRAAREQERAVHEAQQIREAVGLEKARAVAFYKHAEPGETYRGHVIGRTDRYVIQADDKQPGAIVLHERAAVSGAEKVRMNEHAEISYPHGRAGIVRDNGKQHQAQRQMQKAGVQHERGR